MKNKIIIFNLVYLLLGCASSPNTNSAHKSVDKMKGSEAYISLARSSRSTVEQCPASAKTWRGEDLKNIIDYAGHCVRLGFAERVEQIGNFLSQKYYQLPWGPYYMSLAAELRKEYARAVWMIDLALKRDSKNALLSYQKGRLHWAMGEYLAAHKAFLMAVENNPMFIDAHIFLGQMHFRDRDYQQAKVHFEKAKAIQQDNIDATVGLAEANISMNNSRLGITFYEEAVDLSPRNISYKLKLASLYENVNKDFSAALLIYKRIRGLIAESRSEGAGAPADLNERIRRLEAHLAAQLKEEKQKKMVSRETSSEATVNKNKVKK